MQAVTTGNNAAFIFSYAHVSFRPLQTATSRQWLGPKPGLPVPI
jgi:hypothetical protein